MINRQITKQNDREIILSVTFKGLKKALIEHIIAIGMQNLISRIQDGSTFKFQNVFSAVPQSSNTKEY